MGVMPIGHARNQAPGDKTRNEGLGISEAKQSNSKYGAAEWRDHLS